MDLDILVKFTSYFIISASVPPPYGRQQLANPYPEQPTQPLSNTTVYGQQQQPQTQPSVISTVQQNVAPSQPTAIPPTQVGPVQPAQPMGTNPDDHSTRY